MKLHNLKHPLEQVNFQQAVVKGLGLERGLFFTNQWPKLDEMDKLLAMPFQARSIEVLNALIGDELDKSTITEMVNSAFNFDVPVAKVDENRFCLELFHGRTLAFKDFGARFMAQCLTRFNPNKVTILTATSGDTGAAVADAFYGLENIDVVVLYPKGRISELQEKLFCTLGGNIRTVAVEADFDACQDLVKASFEDSELKEALGLNSANSINISRLLAQVCYYFEAVAQYKANRSDDPVIAVPSGNFGNITAGLIAKAMGLPVKRFVAATNENDTVPRYLNDGKWQVNKTVATESNAMDVSDPSNWPRAEFLIQSQAWSANEVTGVKVSEQGARDSVRQMKQLGYLSEPHAAIAAQALSDNLEPGEGGIFVGTAHPAKFQDVVETILEEKIEVPAALLDAAKKPLLSDTLPAEFNELKRYLMA